MSKNTSAIWEQGSQEPQTIKLHKNLAKIAIVTTCSKTSIKIFGKLSCLSF